MIPGFIISLLTFPGVIVHEIAHQAFCKLFRLAVTDVCYFRLGNPCGYVIHEKPQNEFQQIMVGVGPFLVNSIVGALIALPGIIPVRLFNSGTIMEYVMVWLGVSIAMHAFPSTGDAKTILGSLNSPDTPLTAQILGYPIVALIWVGAIGSVVWLDLIYGVAVSMLLPKLLTAILA